VTNYFKQAQTIKDKILENEDRHRELVNQLVELCEKADKTIQNQDDQITELKFDQDIDSAAETLRESEPADLPTLVENETGGV